MSADPSAARTDQQARQWWYVSTERMTFAVEVTDGVVTNSAPIGRRFIGQPAKNLGTWLRRQGGFRTERLA